MSSGLSCHQRPMSLRAALATAGMHKMVDAFRDGWGDEVSLVVETRDAELRASETLKSLAGKVDFRLFVPDGYFQRSG